MHDLKVWPNVPADGNLDTTTPGKTSGKEDEMSRLAKVLNVLCFCVQCEYSKWLQLLTISHKILLTFPHDHLNLKLMFP
jgi:hypothetical protein